MAWWTGSLLEGGDARSALWGWALGLPARERAVKSAALAEWQFGACAPGGGHMGNRLSKIYTRTGDDGTTGLGDGTRVPKESARVEAYGTADELNSVIGMLLAVPGLPDAVTALLTEVQHELFDLG